MSKFLSTRFKDLEAYTPGEQPRDQVYTKLNTNESPFPPAPGVIDVLNREETEKLKLYSDPTAKALREKIGEVYGFPANQIFVSNGSDEILNFAFMAFCDADNGVRYPEISYGFYPVYAQLYGLQATSVPLCDDFSIDYRDYCDCNQMVVIANPNAPTGLTLGLDEIESIVSSNPNHVVLIDEAYVDFGAMSCIDLIHKYDNLLVVQTFSKSRSLAGGRLGFAFGSKEVIADLETIKYSTNPYNVNRLTQLAGIAAVEDVAYFRSCCKQIAENRAYTMNKLRAMGFVFTDSKSNFIFAAYPGMDGQKLYESLRQRGVLVRHFNKEKIKDYLRITVGSREQMDILLQALREIIKENG